MSYCPCAIRDFYFCTSVLLYNILMQKKKLVRSIAWLPWELSFLVISFELPNALCLLTVRHPNLKK